MWQWLYNGVWVDCESKNNETFQKHFECPTLEPMYMVNTLGELWGTSDSMKFRIHGGDEEVETFIRQGPTPSESPLLAVVEEGGDFILPYELSQKICGGQPFEQQVGTDLFKFENNILFKHVDGHFVEKSYHETGISKWQFEDMTSTRFVWEFRGPFRWERMSAAIEKLKARGWSDILNEILESYDPEADLSEYGPYQFPDYLAAHGHTDLAFELIDIFSREEQSDWAPFDGQTNALIEKGRNNQRPGVNISVKDHQYMILFDSGTGSSGSDPVVIRPTRYQKILESIEEHFVNIESQSQRRVIRELLSTLTDLGISPRVFLLGAAHQGDSIIDRLIPEVHRVRVRTIVNQMRTSHGNLSTRIQEFLPALLNKFNECEIRICREEILNTKPVCKLVTATLSSGLRRPREWKCANFLSMIQFLRQNQSWDVPGSGNCDICGETSQVTLSHCSGEACMKCWVDTLHETRGTCPFCRTDVEEGTLKQVIQQPKNATKTKSRVKKRKRSASASDILSIIQQDTRYAKVTSSTAYSMQRWYTILVRKKILKMAQLPKNSQKVCTFENAIKEFKIV